MRLTLLLLMSLCATSVAHGNESSARVLRKVAAQERSVNHLLSEMFKLNMTLRKIVRERGALEDRKNRANIRINKLNVSIGELSTGLQAHQKILIDVVMDRKKRERETLLSVLMSSKSPAQMERQMRTLETIANHHSTILRDYLRDLELLKIDRRQVTEERLKLARMEVELKEREKQLAEEHAKKSQVLANLRKSRREVIGKLSSIKRNKGGNLGKEAAAIESLLSGPALYEMKGALSAPLRGILERSYGIYEDPQFKVSLPHSGIFLGAPEGSPVQAISDGSVIFSGDVPGMGSTVVIDHGDHFFSVYGGASHVRAEEGLKVRRGDLIASAGRSTQNGLEGLYFEIRHFTEPQDPLQWIKGVHTP